MNDTLARYNLLKQQAINAKATYDSYTNTMQDLKTKYFSTRDELQKAKDFVAIQEATVETMRIIIDRMSAEQIKRVTNLMTFALQSIFFDKNYSVELEISDKRGLKSAEFFLVEKMDDGKVLRTEFVDGIGGGVKVVVGFALQVYYINYFGLSRVIFCDESFSQLSDIYMPYLKEFLHKLTEKLHFTFVLVTHDIRLVEGADKCYNVNDGIVTEITEKQAIKVVKSDD